MPLIKQLKVPGNVLMTTSFLVIIATFDLIPTGSLIDDKIYYLPEEDPYNMHFMMYGYNSRLLIGNMGM